MVALNFEFARNPLNFATKFSEPSVLRLALFNFDDVMTSILEDAKECLPICILFYRVEQSRAEVALRPFGELIINAYATKYFCEQFFDSRDLVVELPCDWLL